MTEASTTRSPCVPWTVKSLPKTPFSVTSTVATTWSLSFRQVEQRSAAAADLLRLCAFVAPDNEIVLSDPTISRYHLELHCEEGVLVRDLGSRNGTFVNDVRIREAVVPIGARVRLGGSVLRPGGLELELELLDEVLPRVQLGLEALALLRVDPLLEGPLPSIEETRDQLPRIE